MPPGWARWDTLCWCPSSSPPGRTQTANARPRELASLLHVSPAAVANSLKCLERDGYIRREPWQRDARRNRVFLTEKGAAAVKGCRNVFRRVSARMMAGFSLEECSQLMGFQRRMLDNLTHPDSHEKE